MDISFLRVYIYSILYTYTFPIINYTTYNTFVMCNHYIKNTIEKTMKVTFNGKEYEIKYSFRAYMIYENIMGKSFSPQGLTDMIVFFYSSLLSVAKGDIIKYEDFLDWLDDNPDELSKFSNWLMECLGLNKFLTPEVKDNNKKANNKEDKPKN